MSGTLYKNLNRLGRHWLGRELSRRILPWLGVNLIMVTLLCIIDNLSNLTPDTRLVLIALIILVNVLGVASLFIRFLHKPKNNKQLAILAEKTFGITDNSLINAVEFDQKKELPGEVLKHFTLQADQQLSQQSFQKVWRIPAIFRGLKICFSALCLAILYFAIFNNHAMNAIQRFADPDTDLTPINYTQFQITPGDADLYEGESIGIYVHAEKNGHLAAQLNIMLKDTPQSVLQYPMDFVDGKFYFEVRNAETSIQYAIQNGRDQSRWYKLNVRPIPQLRDINIEVTPPSYTNLPSYTISKDLRQASIPKGSMIKISPEVVGNDQLALLANGKTVDITSSILINEDIDLRVRLENQDGAVNPNAWRLRTLATPDSPPKIRFTNQEFNIKIGLGQSFFASLEASDDYQVQQLKLRLQDGTILKEFQYKTVSTKRNEQVKVFIDEKNFQVNRQYKLYGVAIDNSPAKQERKTSVPLTLHIVDYSKDMLKGEADNPYVMLFKKLHLALDKQKSAQTYLAERVGTIHPKLHNHFKNQQAIHQLVSEASGISAQLYQQNKIKLDLKSIIEAIAQQISEPLLRDVEQLPKNKEAEALKQAMNEAAKKQGKLILALQRVLGILAERQQQEEKEEDLEDDEQDLELEKAVEKLQENLSKFKEEQRKMVEQTEEIDKKDPEDWTEEEEEIIDEIAARQTDFARMFKAAFNDLSKLQNQDFSNSHMADEFIEMFEELQKAGEALNEKKTEIATAAEEMGLEQAESIETNLERWLADKKDHLQWNAEESGMQDDVPLQDLPDELTDIIGDLIDEESEMSDVEDSTNSFLSAVDEGAGWGVSDGNIDSMAAKGITGNILPNDNEVGGRSGEGRSGKSSGQFVEKEAFGKGGRMTPTRLTQSPYEQGTVKDHSTEAVGGATGGGKQSGYGDQGLRGITPDQQPDVEKRLGQNQAELKQKAEAVLRTLTVHNLPTGDLEEAINQMDLIARQEQNASGIEIRQVQSDVVSALKESRAAVNQAIKNRAVTLKEKQQKSVDFQYEQQEQIDADFQQPVDEYFKALND
ncbi:MAG: DUF4175 domain-containing protein [Lentisphaeria bacterium]|nr:DUF4175 domain-containing protein [Lentisphaeria bacterium]